MISAPVNSTIDSVVRILKDCRSILFITGAGISAESGLGTYRGATGLYNGQPTEEGFQIEEIMSASMLAENPALTWKYFLARIDEAKNATFNQAHEIIARMETRFVRTWTLTQNVDGFHHAAGAKNLVEAHGTMRRLCCNQCAFTIDAADFEIPEKLPPACPRCGGLIRPDVILFGELIRGDGLRKVFDEIEKGFDIIITIGTSSVFPYIQHPIKNAKLRGIPTVEINPSETTVSLDVDYHIPLPATKALGEVWDRLNAN